MKKLFLILIALMVVVSSVACEKDVEKSKPSSAEGTLADAPEKPEDTAENQVKKGPETEKSEPAKADNDEILESMLGYFVLSDYIKKFEETKSLEIADDIYLMLYFNKTDSGYAVMPGNSHQGTDNLAVISTEADGNGRYIIKTEASNEFGPCEILYTVGKNTAECKLDPDKDYISTGGETKEFEHFKSEKEFSRRMSEIALGGAEDVEFSGDEVFVYINKEKYSLSFINDYTGICADGIDMSGYNGAFWLTKENSDDSVITRFKYTDTLVSFADENGNIIASFNK